MDVLNVDVIVDVLNVDVIVDVLNECSSSRTRLHFDIERAHRIGARRQRSDQPRTNCGITQMELSGPILDRRHQSHVWITPVDPHSAMAEARP